MFAGVERGFGAMLRHGEPIAVIEMAQASGYALVPANKREPGGHLRHTARASSICEALDAGCGQIVVGMGGSATVDGGTGMAAALGFKFLDGEGRELAVAGGSLEKTRSIDASWA